MDVYVIDPIHIFSRAGGVGENVNGGTMKRVEVVENWTCFLTHNITCKIIISLTGAISAFVILLSIFVHQHEREREQVAVSADRCGSKCG